jgi:hypothetical protein
MQRQENLMINLKNGYSIVSDGKSYTLVQDAIQKSKEGVETEIKKQISFHSTLSSALQGYSNCVMADLVSNFDMDLKDVKKAIDELKKEIKAYETR